MQQLVAEAEKAIVEGKMQDGVELLRGALRDDPNVANEVYNTAFALHGGAAQRNQSGGGNKLYFSAGLAELDAAIAVMKLLTVPPFERSDVWYQLGLFLDHRCQFEEAIAAYNQAIDLEPDGPDACDALACLGILFYNRGRGSLGTKSTDTSGCVAYSPFNSDFARAEEALLKAISVGEKLISKDQSCQQAVINAHRLLRDIESDRLQGSKALEHCMHLYRLDPGDKDTIQWLRQAEKNTGKKLLPIAESDPKRRPPTPVPAKVKAGKAAAAAAKSDQLGTAARTDDEWKTKVVVGPGTRIELPCPSCNVSIGLEDAKYDDIFGGDFFCPNCRNICHVPGAFFTGSDTRGLCVTAAVPVSMSDFSQWYDSHPLVSSADAECRVMHDHYGLFVYCKNCLHRYSSAAVLTWRRAQLTAAAGGTMLFQAASRESRDDFDALNAGGCPLCHSEMLLAIVTTIPDYVRVFLRSR